MILAECEKMSAQSADSCMIFENALKMLKVIVIIDHLKSAPSVDQTRSHFLVDFFMFVRKFQIDE